MKEFTVEIGDRERRLRFASRDAIELKRRFGKTPSVLLFTDTLGLDEDGKRKPMLMDPEVQVAVLFHALRRGGSKVTEEQVLDWVDQHLEKGGELGDLVVPAAKCALYSGAITGRQIDLDAGAEEPGKAAAGSEAAS